MCTPLSHAADFIADGTLSAGGTVVLHRDFDPADVLATIERERITTMMVLPCCSTRSSVQSAMRMTILPKAPRARCSYALIASSKA